MEVNPETRSRLMTFASLISETNSKFNITGFKTEEEVLEKLILGSLDPLCDINVPRGTTFVDIGSGAGIPGLVLAIFFKGISGTLIESNNKKADFIKRTANELGLKAVEVIHDRAENIAGLKNYRESFDWCFSRAFGSPFIAVEIGAPLVKPGGFLYIYSGKTGEALPEETLDHARKTGLSPVPSKKRAGSSMKNAGILFEKTGTAPDSFPRNYPAIKRDAERIKGSAITENADDS